MGVKCNRAVVLIIIIGIWFGLFLIVFLSNSVKTQSNTNTKAHDKMQLVAEGINDGTSSGNFMKTSVGLNEEQPATYAIQSHFHKMPGGLNEEQPATVTVQTLIDSNRAEIEAKAEITFVGEMIAVVYSYQVVNGIRWYIKVAVDGQYIHVTIIQSFNREMSTVVRRVETGKSLTDKIGL